jgi:hypothetical protein
MLPVAQVSEARPQHDGLEAKNWRTPSVMVEALTLLLHIREVPGANLEPDTGYFD